MIDAIKAGIFPDRITVEFSLSCNLRCCMCPRRFLDTPNGFMPKSLFMKIVDEISAYPLSAVVIFFRGESLLHPDFAFMVDYLKQKTRTKLQLATNGLLMTHDMAGYLLEKGMDFVSFSLDAYTKETYEQIRRGSDFDKVIDNLHHFLTLNNSGRHPKCEVQVSATENEFNQKELSAFSEYWKTYVDRVRVYPQHSENGVFGKLVNKNGCTDRAERQPCPKLFNDMVIYYNGDVALCNHDWNRSKEDIIGNINSASIKSIWSGDVYRKIRKSHLQGNWEKESVCSGCDHWNSGKDTVVGKLIRGDG